MTILALSLMCLTSNAQLVWKISQFNLWVALILSAFLFGAAHIINPNATVISTIGISLSSGVLFGLLFTYYRTLWVPIGIHWSWNFVQGLWQDALFPGAPRTIVYLNLSPPVLNCSLEGFSGLKHL